MRQTHILKKKTELDNISKENIDSDALLKYFRHFIKNMASLWHESNLDKKIAFQDYIFPEGIFIENNILRTTQINPILKALEDYKDRVINSLSPMGPIGDSNFLSANFINPVGIVF